MTYEEALEIIEKHAIAVIRGTSKNTLGEALEIATKALEKQNPKTTIYHFGEYLCKECGAVVEHTKSEYNRYCQYCGQALDWSEEE